MWKQLKDQFDIQLNEIYKQTNYLISLIKNNDETLIDHVYESAIISMCIKYETFTVDVYSDLFNQTKVVYNRPWYYTRKIAHRLNINLGHKYYVARDLWVYYNTLKHINVRTKNELHVVAHRYNLNDRQAAFVFAYQTLSNLISLFHHD